MATFVTDREDGGSTAFSSAGAVLGEQELHQRDKRGSELWIHILELLHLMNQPDDLLHTAVPLVVRVEDHGLVEVLEELDDLE